MQNYLIIVTSVIIFLAVFEGVLPKGHFGKSVKTVISMVVVIVILTPILNVFKKDYDFSNILNENSQYVDYLNEYKRVTLEKEITSFLVINGYDVIRVNALISDDENLVEIFLKKDELLTEDEHIDNLEKAKSLVVERFYLSSWEVKVG